MRRHAKVTAARIPGRKSITSGTAASRRSFSGWIDEPGAAFSSIRQATPRVRDGLVLRRVIKNKASERTVAHASFR